MGDLPLNQILCGDCVEVMQTWPADSIDLVVTSPPYWGLRSYGKETVLVWGGDSTCNHDFSKPAPPPRQRSKNDIVNQKSKQAYKDNPSAYDSTESSFCSKCGAWLGSLGLEPHPQLFIDHLVEICREIKRVLKPTGTFWLNLGDSYCSGHGNINEDFNKRIGNASGMRKQEHKRPSITPTKSNWLQPKQKLMIPSRVAIALQHDGWILRSDIIWHKVNHMPSSVKDRLTCAYEHIFLFAKQRRYYFDLDSIRVPHSASTIQRITQPNVMNQQGGEKQIALRGKKKSPKDRGSRSADMVKSLAENYEEWYFEEREKKSWHDHEHDETMGFGQQKRGFKVKNIPHPRGKNPGDIWEVEEKKLTKHDIAVGRIGNFSYTDPLHTKEYHPKGKNPGDLWRIPTMPFKGAHFSTFPPKLIEPIVKAGCPRWICSRCGKPRERISKTEHVKSPVHGDGSIMGRRDGGDNLTHYNGLPRVNAVHHTVGWSDCGCEEANWVGGIVLDPFAGSGTALRVARKLGRRFIGIEINSEYAEMARQRVRGKYKPVPEGVVQLDQIMEDKK